MDVALWNLVHLHRWIRFDNIRDSAYSNLLNYTSNIVLHVFYYTFLPVAIKSSGFRCCIPSGRMIPESYFQAFTPCLYNLPNFISFLSLFISTIVTIGLFSRLTRVSISYLILGYNFGSEPFLPRTHCQQFLFMD